LHGSRLKRQRLFLGAPGDSQHKYRAGQPQQGSVHKASHHFLSLPRQRFVLSLGHTAVYLDYAGDKITVSV
jgi:hypothetical protein